MAHRTIVIGINNRGRKLAQTVAAHPHFDLAGLADIDPERLEQAAQELQVPKQGRYSDYKAALASGDFQVAVIALPNHLHYSATKDVLNADMHCLTEKPFVLEMAHAEELVDLADRKKVVLEVVQNFRTSPPLVFIKDFIAKQGLGRLAGVQGSLHRYRRPRSRQEQQLPCSVLFIQGIHHLDWLRTALPAPIKTVIGRFHQPPWSEWKCPSICQVMLECRDGVLVNYRASSESRGELTSYQGRWRFEFEKGDLILDDNQDVWQITEPNQTRQLLHKFDAEVDNNAPLLDGLHAAIVQGIEPPTSGRDNLKTLRIILDIVRTANQAQWNSD